ncbi:MAG: flagellar hook-basal body complex protein FliE [Solirubrobacterales bacterium 70-9]|nr:MAG: flagellar hook-basal body complex protein FliE [Solirubrobacterales bacterium 70-9]
MAIPPPSSITAQAAQWSLQGPAKAPAPSDPAGGFGSMLTNAVGDLEKTQEAAAVQSQALATGQTQDISSVITAVQEASLSMQLAAQVRNKAVEAYTEIFHTQV